MSDYENESELLEGPWRWMDSTALVQDTGTRPAVLAADAPLRTYGEHGILRTLDPDEPRAQLIAAAPQLRDALVKVHERLHEIDVALCEGRVELANEVWKHACSEVEDALDAVGVDV